MNKLYIASDHAGYDLKEVLTKSDILHDYQVIDLGPFNEDSVDYPDFAHPLATAVEGHIASLGILICGSGNGVCMSANKHKHIRAALAWNAEIAKLARQHNNANVLCLPARFVSATEAKNIVTAFLQQTFEGGRHERRVNKI